MPAIKAHGDGASDDGDDRVFPGAEYLADDGTSSSKRKNSGKRIRIVAKTGERRTYADMLRVAIESFPYGQAYLFEIYDNLKETYPCFQAADDSSWKNSVRHNLSIHSQFQRIPIAESIRARESTTKNRKTKGSAGLWTVRPQAHQQNPPSGSPVDGVPSVPQQQYRAVPPGHAAGMPMGGGYQYRPMMMQHMGGMPHNLYAVGPRGELVALNHLPPGLMAQQHMMPRGGPPMQMAYGGYPQHPMAQQAMQHQPPMQHQSPMSQAAMSSAHVLAHNRAHAAAGQARQQQQQIMASHAASTLASLSPAHSESSSGQAMPASGHAAASVHPTWQRQPPPKQSAAPASYQREHQQSTVDAT
eukprot:m.76881 g.76881  ORF g.76881 m.76881 type:complete len:358 (+) comp9094_c0_seq2:852-1925(+)